MRKIELTQEQLKRINSWQAKQVSAEINVSLPSLKKYLRENGLYNPKRGRPPLEINLSNDSLTASK